jgi:hypothetical protein
MGILNNSNAIPVSGAYELEDSLRFRSSASASLTRTYGTPTSARIFTLSMWVKRGKLGSLQQLYSGFTDSTNRGFIAFQSGDFIACYVRNSGGDLYEFSTPAVFRDPSAWYHIVVAFDTTQGTATNRVKVYVNGVQQTLTLTTTTQDVDLSLNTSGSGKAIGQSNSIEHFDGYLTEVNFVDGQQLTPSDFGETDDNGTWIPKRYTGTYGTNGFYLKGRGTDNSGNGNNFTENNIDTSSGDATYDLMSDVPTLTDEDTSNFATLNPNNMAVNTTMTDGNLKASNSVNHATMFPTIIPTTGKYYFECTMPVHAAVGGIGFRTDTNKVESAYSDEANKYYYYLNNSNAYRIVETTNTAYGSNLNSGTATFQVAIDFDAAKYYFGRNNTWYAADWGTDGDPASGTNPSYDLTDGTKIFPFVYVAGITWAVNFGQQPFNYTPPTGFKKWNTFNLPDSTIEDGSEHFDVKLDTGADIKSTSEGVFTNQWYWIKDRANTNNHQLIDSVRGLSAVVQSNTNATETTYSAPSGNSVGWVWRGSDSSAVSNTDGSIASTVSANPTAGFSIVRYSGNATSGATVGHGLSAAPEFVIGKTLSTSGYDWAVYATALGDTSKTLTLNLTAAAGTETNKYNGTAPSATLVTLGNHATNLSGTNNQVLYCFAPVEGYSKFGKYTGNGSADGPFVYTGFKPAWIMTKRTNSTSQWAITDTARSTYNVAKETLEANTSAAESSGTAYQIDILSNGFKLRDADDARNGSGDTYIYMAFAENPFKNSNAR